MMSTKGNLLKTAIFLSAITYQAVEQINLNGECRLPKGYKLVRQLGSHKFPYLGYIIESSRYIILSFRGTHQFIEIVKDIDIFQIDFPFVAGVGKTHQGFTEIYRQVVREPIMETLQQLSPSKKLIITGHSLGGALATLSAIDIASHTSFKEPVLYTFGSPRVGDTAFAQAFNHRIQHSIRINNPHDIVTLFPPVSSLGGIQYRHVGRGWIVQFKYFNMLKNHKMDYYFKSLCHLYPAYSKQLKQRNPQLFPLSKESRISDKLKVLHTISQQWIVKLLKSRESEKI